MKCHQYKNRFILLLLIGIFFLITGCLLEPQGAQNTTQLPTGETRLPTAESIILNTNAALPTLPPVNPITDYGNDYKAIRLAWFYNAPSNSDLPLVAQKYSSFILTHNDENKRDALRAAGVKGPFLQYLYLAAIKNPGSCSREPSNDQVANQPGDFCDILDQHPEWFLKSNTGSIITKSNGSVLMDPSNNDWRNFWLERARSSIDRYGWDGVFLDNVEASIYKPYEYGSEPDPTLNDAAYQAMIEDNLRFLYTNYFKPNNRPLYANIIALKDTDVWFRYMQYLDGAMFENFAVGWDDEYKDPEDWETQLQIAEKTQELGKSMILVSQGDEFDTNRQVFALASYLLINNGKAYFRYIDSSSYEYNWYYDNYSFALGTPAGSRVANGSTWERAFSNGKVWVNPNNHTAGISMN